MKTLLVFVCICVSLGFGNETRVHYEPNWPSLDKRPLPKWYDDAKFGIFIHWGVYSVPSYSSGGYNAEWFWYAGWNSKYRKENFPPNFSYQEFAKDFTAEFFDPDEWAEIFRKSGAKYVVLTSKHLDGFTLWPSKQSFSWNAVDTGPHRDLVGDLGKAIKSKGLHYGLYYSLREIKNQLDLLDVHNEYKTQYYVNDKVYPDLLEIVNKYQPEVIWADGDQRSIPKKNATHVAYASYWKAQEYFAWLYNDSPVRDTVVVNDRWGKDVPKQHGDFFTNDEDKWMPSKIPDHKWESCWMIDKKSFGYRRNANLNDFFTVHELLKLLIKIVSGNGNLLLDIGPTKEGTITPIFQDRLLGMGKWLEINGEAIYGTHMWKHRQDKNENIWYTSTKDAVYAITVEWPKNDKLILEHSSELFHDKSGTLKLLGESKKIKWTKKKNTVTINFPNKATVKSEYCWVVKIPRH